SASASSTRTTGHKNQTPHRFFTRVRTFVKNDREIVGSMKTIAIVLLSLSTATAAAAQMVEPPQIIVTGEGVVKATPDQAWVSIGSETRSKISKDAQQRNAEAMTAVIQKIMAFGIQKEAIKTTAIDLQMEFDYAN